MAFKTFAPGVLTSSDVNTFLMRQSVITCTAATRPASPNEGMTIYETDTDLYRVYSGTAWEVVQGYGAWTTYTPTVANWTLGNGTIFGAYMRVGRMVTVRIEVKWGSTSTFVGAPAFTLPINRSAVNLTDSGTPCGAGYASDVSAGKSFPLLVSIFDTVPDSLNLFVLEANPSNIVENNQIISSRPFTWTTNDVIKMQFSYEADS
jgi:hypothetical protein